MSVGEALAQLGGVSDRATLVKATSRAQVDRALREGELVRVARGRYAGAAADEALRAAHAVHGVLSHTSAALRHGWPVKTPPSLPHVIVPRKRQVSALQRRRVQPHFADLQPGDVNDRVTRPEKTLEHCLRHLPFDEGLAVADSALRAGIPPSTLRRVAASVRGQGAAKVRRVAKEARPEAANPFESCLRAISLDVTGLRLVPQSTITVLGSTFRPDLVDDDLGIVVEADSFEWHGDRVALRRDCRRYDLLVAGGWVVLRFAWEDVMFDPSFVVTILEAVVAKQAKVRPAA